MAKLANPLAYRAPFVGYNLHLDQNEKLADIGTSSGGYRGEKGDNPPPPWSKKVVKV